VGAVTTGLRGPVDRCEISKLHDDAPRHERPAAAYLVYPMPCEVPSCEGRLVCIGHAVCPGCAAAIRSDQTVWADTEHDVDVAMIHGATR